MYFNSLIFYFVFIQIVNGSACLPLVADAGLHHIFRIKIVFFIDLQSELTIILWWVIYRRNQNFWERERKREKRLRKQTAENNNNLLHFAHCCWDTERERVFVRVYDLVAMQRWRRFGVHTHTIKTTMFTSNRGRPFQVKKTHNWICFKLDSKPLFFT